MVINDKYKFIFLHVPKAAGTSVSKSLSALDGNNRRLLAETAHETLSDFLSNVSSRKHIIDKLLLRDYRSYYRFAFVRNPWDRIASVYRYLKEKKPRVEIDTVSSFEDFLFQFNDGIEWICELNSMKPQTDYVTIDGRLAVDFLGHFEYLREDFSKVKRDLGISVVLPHSNRSSNSKSDYRSNYTDDTASIVASKFSGTISRFGYVFDDPAPRKRFSSGAR